MRDLEPPFDLEVDGKVLRISEHELAGKRVFHVNFWYWGGAAGDYCGYWGKG